VSFESAAEIFLDPLAISIYDEEHSSDEDHWVTIRNTIFPKENEASSIGLGLN
jgi:uncharacterized DUF497 family protein